MKSESPMAVGMAFPPTARVAGVPEMRQPCRTGPAEADYSFLPTHGTAGLMARRQTGDCPSPWDAHWPWRVWGHAQSGLTAKRPGTGGLG